MRQTAESKSELKPDQKAIELWRYTLSALNNANYEKLFFEQLFELFIHIYLAHRQAKKPLSPDAREKYLKKIIEAEIPKGETSKFLTETALIRYNFLAVACCKLSFQVFGTAINPHDDATKLFMQATGLTMALLDNKILKVEINDKTLSEIETKIKKTFSVKKFQAADEAAKQAPPVEPPSPTLSCASSVHSDVSNISLSSNTSDNNPIEEFLAELKTKLLADVDPQEEPGYGKRFWSQQGKSANPFAFFLSTFCCPHASQKTPDGIERLQNLLNRAENNSQTLFQAVKTTLITKQKKTSGRREITHRFYADWLTKAEKAEQAPRKGFVTIDLN